jgi:hypothetical protein
MSEDTSGPGLSPDERAALSSVLDEIIPRGADGRLPGAGEAGIVTAIEQAQRRSPELRAAIDAGLSALGALLEDRGVANLSGLAGPQRLEVMNELAARAPTFVPGLVFHTYVAYYQHDDVVRALGLEPRPPYPRGYALEEGDLSLLDPVRRRDPLFRRC